MPRGSEESRSERRPLECSDPSSTTESSSEGPALRFDRPELQLLRRRACYDVLLTSAHVDSAAADRHLEPVATRSRHPGRLVTKNIARGRGLEDLPKRRGQVRCRLDGPVRASRRLSGAPEEVDVTGLSVRPLGWGASSNSRGTQRRETPGFPGLRRAAAQLRKALGWPWPRGWRADRLGADDVQ